MALNKNLLKVYLMQVIDIMRYFGIHNNFKLPISAPGTAFGYIN